MKAPALGHGAQARQGLQPALGTLRVGQAQADPALAAVRRKLAVELRRGAGQLGLQPALQRGGGRVDAQLLARDLGLQGVQLQARQLDLLALPAALQRQLLQAQRGGALGLRAFGCGAAQVGGKAHGAIGIAVGAGLAAQRGGVQQGVQGGWVQRAQLGAALQGVRGRLVAALQADAALADVQLGLGKRPLFAVIAGARLQPVKGQALAIPGAGLGVLQRGVQPPAVVCGLQAGAAGEPRARRLGPQRGQVQRLQFGGGLQQRLAGPGRQAGLQVGVQWRAAFGACAAQLRRDVQAPGGACQAALQLCPGLRLQLRCAAGQGGVHAAVQLGRQGHGGACLQLGLQRIAALGQVELLHLQSVLRAVVAVVAGQAFDGDGAGAGPGDALKGKGQLHLQRQQQLLQRLGRFAAGLALGCEGDLCRLKL